MRRNLLIVVLVLVVAAFGYWYRENNLKTLDVTYSYANGAVDGIQSLVIKKYGLDTKNHLNITFKHGSPGELERQLLAREADIAQTSPMIASKANLDGKALRLLSPQIHMSYNILVPAASPIKTLADLKGKKVAVAPKVTAAYTAFALVLRSADINPEIDLNLIFGSIPDAVKHLQNGEVEAATVSYPLAATLVESGKFRVLTRLEDEWIANEGVSLPFVVMVAYADWLEDPINRKIAKRLAATLHDAATLIAERPDVVTEESNTELNDYLTQNNLSKDTVKAILREKTAKDLYTSWGNDEVSAIERVIKRAKEYGLLPPNAPEDIIIKPSDL